MAEVERLDRGVWDGGVSWFREGGGWDREGWGGSVEFSRSLEEVGGWCRARVLADLRSGRAELE